jgi:hypothetical protein
MRTRCRPFAGLYCLRGKLWSAIFLSIPSSRIARKVFYKKQAPAILFL